MAKKKANEEIDDEPNNDRPLTPDEISKIELRKKIKELREKNRDQVAIIVTKAGEVKRSDTLTLEEQKEEFARCSLNPFYFIETYLTIFDQTKGEAGEIVPFKLFDFQKDLIRSYIKFKRNIANKYRQAGISTATCAYIAWYVMFSSNRKVAVVADKLETARDELMSDIIDFIENSPSYLRPTIAKKDTLHHKKYTNGSEMKAFATKTLRGYTATLIFWDETAWAENGEKFWTAAAPAVNSTGGRTIFVSTPNGLDSVFYATFDKAIKKENDFNAVELWWYNDPRYNKGLYWVKNEGKDSEFKIIDDNFSFETRKKYQNDGFKPKSAWYETIKKTYNGNVRKLAQEVECSFLGSGANFIAEEYVKRIEDHEKMAPIAEEWEDKLMWIFEDPLPDTQYVIATDVSTGHGDDYSAVDILKIKDIIEELNIVDNGVLVKKKVKRRKTEQVGQYYGKVTPQYLAQIVYAYGQKYNFAYAVIDVTGGVGLGTMEKLLEYGYPTKCIHYSEIQHKPTRDRLNGYVKTINKEVTPGNFLKVDLIPGFMIGANRAMVLHELERSVRMQDIIIRSIRTISEFKTFQTVTGSKVAEAKRSFHDDDILALAIGQYVISFDMSKGLTSDDKIRAMLDSIMVIGVNDNIQPDEIKKREGTDVRHHANPNGQHSWVVGNVESLKQLRKQEIEEKLARELEIVERLRNNPNLAKYL
jgi:hypothetical protein